LAVVSENWIKSASGAITPARIDTSAPNEARVWDSMNGGRDNFEADRRVARQLVAATPELAHAAPAVRAFCGRVARHAAEAGIRQFLDISQGLRDASSIHAAGRAVAPGSRFVFVAHDPMVLSHTRAMLHASAEGEVSCVDADPLDIESVLRAVGGVLDPDEPVAVVMTDTMMFLEDASGVVARLAAEMPSGSYLGVIQSDERLVLAARRWNSYFHAPVYLRGPDKVAGWFTGLDLQYPGVTEIQRWRPAPDDPQCPAGLPLLGAVARKR
jgi:S-adenosyl methyltransferase